MEKEILIPLEKNTITAGGKKDSAPATGCCGGAPANNADACCKLDEDKKAEGEAGCGCNTSGAGKSASSCC
jgi:hypothetical protein